MRWLLRKLVQRWEIRWWSLLMRERNEIDEEPYRQPSQSAQQILPSLETPGKYVMKCLVESENPARECDYASSLWLLCLSHTTMEPDANANTLAGEMHSAEQLNIPARLHTNYRPNQTLQVSSVERRQSGLIHCCVSELYGCSSSQDFWAC